MRISQKENTATNPSSATDSKVLQAIKYMLIQTLVALHRGYALILYRPSIAGPTNKTSGPNIDLPHAFFSSQAFLVSHLSPFQVAAPALL